MRNLESFIGLLSLKKICGEQKKQSFNTKSQFETVIYRV